MLYNLFLIVGGENSNFLSSGGVIQTGISCGGVIARDSKYFNRGGGVLKGLAESLCCGFCLDFKKDLGDGIKLIGILCFNSRTDEGDSGKGMHSEDSIGELLLGIKGGWNLLCSGGAPN